MKRVKVKWTLVLMAGIALANYPHNLWSKEAKPDALLFESEKVLEEKNYVLFDFIEFSIFDMAEMVIVNDMAPPPPENPAPAPIKAGKKQKTKKSSAQKSAPKPEAPPASEGEREVRENFVILPKVFYKSLKEEILRQKVPVTLYPTNAPSFAKPLSLFIKVKSIHFATEMSTPEGKKVQPFTLRIYGQIKEKSSDAVLFKYYDSVTLNLDVGQGKAQTMLASASLKLMQDLAAHLKSKY